MKKKILSVLIFIVGLLGGSIYTLHKEDQIIKKWFEICQKDEKIIRLYCFWMRHKGSYAVYLKGLGYQKVAVYGVGYIGKSFINELEDSCVEILYAIDRNPDQSVTGVRIIKPDEVMEGADVVVITALNDYDEIKKEISKKIKIPIISIEDVIYQQC